MRGKTLEITAPFVGLHNVVDFTLAAAVAIKLGVRAEKIENVAKTLTPPKHRFSVSVSGNGVTIIDDGYNANIEGIKSGAESLKYFGGKKFAVFSGIVEGGAKSYELNSEAGRVLRENCDRLIAVGRLADEILSDAQGERVEDLDGAKEILKKKSAAATRLPFSATFPIAIRYYRSRPVALPDAKIVFLIIKNIKGEIYEKRTRIFRRKVLRTRRVRAYGRDDRKLP